MKLGDVFSGVISPIEAFDFVVFISNLTCGIKGL
jgi:hypothetical protein